MRRAPATPLAMALRLEREQAGGAGALMPDPGRPVRLNGGTIPLDGRTEGFPPGFLAGLVPEEVEGREAWRVTLRTDDATGAMAFYNSDGKAFWSVPADASVYSAESGFFRLADLADADSDGLTDAFEKWVSGSGPENRDSDNDGVWDGEEIALGTSPLDDDTDND